MLFFIFAGLCELAVRTEIDCVWDRVRQKEEEQKEQQQQEKGTSEHHKIIPEQAKPYDIKPENRIAFNSVTETMKKLHE